MDADEVEVKVAPGPRRDTGRAQAMVALRRKGMTYREVGAVFGVGRKRASYVVRRELGLLARQRCVFCGR